SRDWSSDVCSSDLTVPSTWRSAEASTLPLMATSAPSTEKVEPPLATGRAAGRGAELGWLGSGFFENMGSSLQERPRVDCAAVDTDFEMEVRAGRAAGVADQTDHLSRRDSLPELGAPGGHVSVAGQHSV